MFGSRNTVGAASEPAIAPSIVASPQPIASIDEHPHADEPRLDRVHRGRAQREPDLREAEERPA